MDSDKTVNFMDMTFRKSYLLPLALALTVWLGSGIRDMISNMQTIATNSRSLQELDRRVDRLEDQSSVNRQVDAVQDEAIHAIQRNLDKAQK